MNKLHFFISLCHYATTFSAQQETDYNKTHIYNWSAKCHVKYRSQFNVMAIHEKQNENDQQIHSDMRITMG